MRLSVLETVSDKDRWHELKRFIERYGHDLFTQRFMNLGNLRGDPAPGRRRLAAVARPRSPTPTRSSACWPSWTGRCRARRPSAG